MFDVKTLAVDGAHPQPRQRGAVLRRAIAFVTGEAVAGVFAVQFSHQRIAGGLGQHRGGGGQRAPVSRAAVGTSQALGAGQVVVVKVERWIGNGRNPSQMCVGERSCISIDRYKLSELECVHESSGSYQND